MQIESILLQQFKKKSPKTTTYHVSCYIYIIFNGGNRMKSFFSLWLQARFAAVSDYLLGLWSCLQQPSLLTVLNTLRAPWFHIAAKCSATLIVGTAAESDCLSLLWRRDLHSCCSLQSVNLSVGSDQEWCILAKGSRIWEEVEGPYFFPQIFYLIFYV